jgi:hypothetical protein
MNLIQITALVVKDPRRRPNPKVCCTSQPAESRSECHCMIGLVDHQAMKGISQKRDTVEVLLVSGHKNSQ